jgi:hypothetical protein
VLDLPLVIFQTNTNSVGVVVRQGDQEPNDSGNRKEDGGEEEAVVVPEPGNRGRGGEGADSTGDFVEDVLNEMAWSDELQETAER